MKRCFISIDIPNELYKKIKKIQDILPEFEGKKTKKENLHLTLKFLGEINDEKIGIIKKKLRKINFEKFEVEIDSLGIFDNRFTKIIWLHLKNCGGLQREIDEKLSDIFPKEKLFMSHLTIARAKFFKDKKAFLEYLKKMKLPKINFIVDNFRLKESVFGHGGMKYNTLQEYKLI